MDTFKGRDILFIGLMLFALFFGAGNLIFPPFLGLQAGHNFWPAMLGFVVTGVGLPVVTVIAVSLAKDGLKELGNRVHPLFAVVFTVAVYLSIGPFFGIPRGANVAFEMGVKPFFKQEANLEVLLFIFTIGFFALVLWLSLNPSKLVDRIGSVLTPILLLAIGVLVVGFFMKLNAPLGEVGKKYANAPFTTGFLEGYLTMDTLGALAFGIVVVNAIHQKNVTSRKQIIQATTKIGIVAGVGLAAVYISIGLLGAKMASAGTFENGSSILTTAAESIFGIGGLVLLGVIVFLACLTTCVGLVTACSQYFVELFPKISYKKYVLAISFVSLFIANLGLNEIISISVPILIIVYPLAIVLVIVSFFDRFFKGSKGVYAGAIILTALVSFYDGFKSFGIEIEAISKLLGNLPLYAEGLGWVIPAVIGAILGYFLDKGVKVPVTSQIAPNKK